MSMPPCADVLIATPPDLGQFTFWIMSGGIVFGGIWGFLFGFLSRDIFVRYCKLFESDTK